MLAHERQRPSEDVGEIGQPVRMRGPAKLFNVEHEIRIARAWLGRTRLIGHNRRAVEITELGEGKEQVELCEVGPKKSEKH